ncbi:MAG TPA: helix-turn-helix transcriptional regulator [Saprospiraceae bacterium]|nr:helix-turn-helix transcriptional regulator [Saprospiraceae bacterium]
MNQLQLRVQLNILPPEVKINNRQRNVLEKLINGQTYKSIASDLKISVPAVRQYAHRLYKKLNVKNRMEAIIEYGLRSDNKSYQQI